MKNLLLYTFLCLLAFSFACKSKTSNQFDSKCSVKKQTINVSITQGEKKRAIDSLRAIEVKATDLVSVVVPANTTQVIRVLYAHPKYKKGKYIDKDKISITDFTAGKPFVLDIKKEPVGAMVRYLFCTDNPSKKNPAPCYPGCFQSRVLVKVVK